MSLKEVFAPYFKIGTSISKWNMEFAPAVKELKEHYNSITAENGMKPMFVLDMQENVENPEKYNTQPALNFDTYRTFLKFAKENKIPMRGHTLVWHNQTPAWFFKKDYSLDEQAPLADRETMLARMESYIRGVLTFVQEEYPDIIYAWDVVNEAMEENEEDGFRKKSLWYQTVGEDFVWYAFCYARKYAAKDVRLFYNDYNTFLPKKREDICNLIVKPLMQEGLIDGIGMQSHLVLQEHDLAEYEEAVHCFGALGLEVQITELDIHCNDSGEESMEMLANMYSDLFAILLRAKRRERANITGVTFWGMKDDESWLTGFRKEKSYPLLFGEKYAKKKAYEAVIKVPQWR